MKKIALVTLDYPPERGGVARYLGELVEAARGNISPVVVEQNCARSGPGQVMPREFFWRGWPHWWPMVRVCREQGRKSGMLLISHLLPVGTAALLAKWSGGSDYVVVCHGLDVRLAFGKPTKRAVASLVLRGAKKVIANSQSTADMIRQVVPGVEVMVLTPGVRMTTAFTRDEARRMLHVAPDERILLSVGRLIKRKGFDLLLEATELLPDDIAVRTVIIGDGAEEAGLKQHAEHLKHPVTFVHGATDEQIALWYAAADIFSLPARESLHDVEGFGIVYLEAALRGLPVVAAKTGGVAEAVVHDETGLLVPPDDVAALADALLSVLRHPDVGMTLGHAGRERALRDFRWEDRWKALSDVLKRG